MLALLFVTGCLTSYEDYLEMRWALLDQDGDGYVWDRFPQDGGTDCDDFNDSIHPNADEIPYNEKDDDCNENTPDDDIDQDGFHVIVDCNDMDATVYPGAMELRSDGIDQDCDGYDPYLWGTNPNGEPLIQFERPPTLPGFGIPKKEDTEDTGNTQSSTEVQVHLFDTDNLISLGDNIEIGIWTDANIQGPLPYTEPPIDTINVEWKEEGVSYSFYLEPDHDFNSPIRAVATTGSIYSVSESLLPIMGEQSALDLFFTQEDTLCEDSKINPDDSAICGWITNETIHNVNGLETRISIAMAEDYTGDEFPDPEIIMYRTDQFWKSDPEFFTVYVNQSTLIDVILFVEVTDSDSSGRIWGRSEPFSWGGSISSTSTSVSLFEEL